MASWIAAGVAFAVAAAVAALAVPPISRVAVLFRAVDLPDPRKHHGTPRPRLGGVALALGIAGGVLAALRVGGTGLDTMARGEARQVVLAGLVVLGLGIVDDFRRVPVLLKFFFQLVAALLIVGLGWYVRGFFVPGHGWIGLGIFGPILTVVWLVGITNAINLLDGLDALAGGVVAIISLSLMCFAILRSEAGPMVVTAAIAGSCLGFLRYNWEPARIFMGDSGSLTLGFSLAVVGLHFSQKSSTAVVVLVPILALGLPMIDTLLVMAVRYLEGPPASWRGRFARMFKADRRHVHHLLELLDPRRSRIVVFLWAWVLACCLMALLVAVSRNPVLGLGLLAIEFGVVLAIRRAGLRRLAEQEVAAQREEVVRAIGSEDGALPMDDPQAR